MNEPAASRTTAVILAAGKGTRMGGDKAKVLYEIAGRPMVCHVLDTCRQVGVDRCLVVVGHQREAVTAAVAAADVGCVVQEQQLGTGHAVQVCAEAIDGNTCLVLCGDAPLVPADLLATVLARRAFGGAACVAVAAEMENPGGYGRMVTDADGHLIAIVEHKDADERQRAIRLVNSGIFAFETTVLRRCLDRLGNDNAQGEYYLTDVIALLVADGERIDLVTTSDAAAVFGVNTAADLAAAQRLYDARGI